MEKYLPPPLMRPDLVGRADLLTTLHSLVERTKQGERYAVLISGEAGIGKSRLVAETTTYATAQGFLPLQGNCFPKDITYPYAPILDLLRTLAVSHPQAPLAIDLQTLAYDIFPLLPELVPDQAIPSLRLDPEQEKHRLFAVLANFFIQLSARSPLLFIIEDLHWSDSTSLDFLHYLVRRSASHRFFLLFTYRHDQIPPELRTWLAQFNRERLAQEIRLAPLSRADIDTLLSSIFDQQHTSLDMRRFLHSDLLDTLSTLTEGNPFFIQEIISSLIAAGDIFYTQGYWNRRATSAISIPRSVQDAVQQRTEHLGEVARNVLTLAAVAGRQFDFALLQQLTRYDEHQLLAIMKELLSAQLVVEESADRFAFRHALTRRAIYTQLLARERAGLHRTIAETIERSSSSPVDASLEDLAYHFYQAHAWQQAANYAQRAGEKALQLYSQRAAIDYFTWALESLDHLAISPSPLLYRARGQAYEALGEFERAQRDYTHALEAARATNDGVAAWQSAIDLGFLWVERDYTQAETWFRQALVQAQSLNDPVLHARSLNRLGNWYLNVEQAHEALRYHQEALAIFEQLHDRRGVAETLDLLGMTSYLGGDLIGGTAYYQQATALFEELGNREGLTSSLATLIMRASTFHSDVLVTVASLAEALLNAQQAVKIAREIGQRSAEAYALFQSGCCLGSQGAYTDALAACQQSLRIAEEIEHRQWQTAAYAMLGRVYDGLLAYQQANEHLEQALKLAQETHSLFWTRITTSYLASVSILLHDYAHAEALLDTALSPDTPVQTLTQRMLWCAKVELALAQGHPTDALEIIDRLDAPAPSGAGGQNALRVLKLRGETLAALQRPAEAGAAFKSALEIAVAHGVRPMQWRILIALGRLYQTQGQHSEAEQALTAAHLLIEELAATITDEPLRSNFLQRATALLPPSHSPSAKPPTKQALAGLTPREREVAILIARGKSNQAIAATMVVSKRTVETHIGNIMFKLGCTSRTQIAVWAVEAGLVSKTETEPSSP